MSHDQLSSPATSVTAAPVVERLAALGPPLLIEGEDGAAYDELLERISTAVKPADIIEDFWVRDVTDLVWEAVRLRRLKVGLMNLTATKGLKSVLEVLPLARSPNILGDWTRKQPEAIEEVKCILRSAGLTIDAVMAQTLSMNLDGIERIELMIARAEARRNAALREIDRHRTTLGQAIRKTIQQIEHDNDSGADTGSAKGDRAA